MTARSTSTRPERTQNPSEPPSDWGSFVRAAESAGAVVLTAIPEAWLALPALIDFDVPAEFASRFEKQTSDAWQCKIGVTIADAAVCRTGSLIVAADARRRRLATAVPDIHLCLVPETVLKANLGQALSVIGNRSATIITGPSRTADIEGVLVNGAHGPRTLAILKLSD